MDGVAYGRHRKLLRHSYSDSPIIRPGTAYASAILASARNDAKPQHTRSVRPLMRLHWPPRALGLGPPLNLLSLSRELRPLLGPRVLQSFALAMAAAALIATIDQFFFGGETARRTPALDAHPTPAMRVLISFVGGLSEELFFRVGVATAVASVAWLALRRLLGEQKSTVATVQWMGTIAAAIYVGVWHTTMTTDATGFMRVVTVNAIANLLYGWTYWRRGLELSTLTHGVLNASLYLGMPLLH